MNVTEESLGDAGFIAVMYPVYTTLAPLYRINFSENEVDMFQGHLYEFNSV